MTQPTGRGRAIFHMHNFAPHPASSAFSATGLGSGWSITAYSFLVVAWYKAEETNVYNAGAINYGYNTILTSYSYESHAHWDNRTPANATDIFTITWTAPDGETPHHYSVYWQLGSSYDITIPGTKCNDADISPADTSYIISSPADESSNNIKKLITESVAPTGFVVTETGGVEWTATKGGGFDAWQASTAYAAGDKIYAGSTHWTCTGAGTSHSSAPTWYDPKSFAVLGNELVCCGVGSSITVGAAGGKAVVSSELIRNANGLMTLITCDATVAAAAPGENVTLKTGIATFMQDGTGGGGVWGALENYTLEPISQWEEQMRDRIYTSYLGHVRGKSLYHDTDAAGITISGTGTMAQYWQLVNLLEWMRARATVWLINRNDAYTDNRYPNAPQYTGKITYCNYLGGLGKNARNSFVLGFQVEAEDPQIAYVAFTP